MKAAVLISGQPRFTRELDDFLKNLINYDQLDFFFYLWNATAGENEFITPSWPNSVEGIRAKISANLPPNSNIIKLEIVDQPTYNPTKEYKLTPWTNANNMWLMFYGIKKVNQLREEWEAEHGNYDLVIRARPDVGIDKPLDLKYTKEFINQNPNYIIMPNNHRHGIGIAVNDMIGVGAGSTMSVYSNVFDHLDQYHDSNVPYHNETLLGHHLNVNGIQYPATDITVVFRQYHHPHHGKIDFGNWI
jgi:hypothetical protein